LNQSLADFSPVGSKKACGSGSRRPVYFIAAISGRQGLYLAPSFERKMRSFSLIFWSILRMLRFFI
jgi:hypothetical protein